ncbi:AMP-binding protein [Micromonospora sp. STR1s_5]|nr:AMP-binding protein [Micromonospora sp. STR1s_5]
MLELDVRNRTIGSLLRMQADASGDRTLLIFEGHRTSYRCAWEIVSNLAGTFLRRGFKPGEHVALLMNNHPNMLWCLFALGTMGAVVVPINSAAKGQQLRYFLRNSRSRALIADDDLLRQNFADVCSVEEISDILIHGAIEPLPEAAGGGRRWGQIESLMAEENGLEVGEAVKFSDTFLIMYTSGTTGPSKGVMCSHAQETSGGRCMAVQMQHKSSDVLYTCLPLFHANALRTSVLAALWAGGGVALARKFSASQFWSDIRSTGSTRFNALGAMANIILRQPEAASDRDNGVDLCNVVPALPREAALEFERRFGLGVTTMYGSTEGCCPVFAVGVPGEGSATCGTLVHPFEMRVVDDDDFPVPNGTVGEFIIRADEPWYMFQGYLDMPKETLQSMRNGWFHSGDRGFRDDVGNFYFVDRKKESVRRRGENISSYEVELALSAHEAVLEAAVVPYPSELGEDEVLAFVVRKEGAEVSEEELIQFCRDTMAKFMVPRYVSFIDQLPKTPSEKIEKYKLRALALENPSVMWDCEAYAPAAVETSRTRPKVPARDCGRRRSRCGSGELEMIGRLLEVGVAVDDVERAGQRFSDRLDAPITELVQAPMFAMAFKMCRLGAVDFELMQATDTCGPIYNFVNKRGSGLHHVAFLVRDIDNVAQEFMQRGVGLAQTEPVELDNLRAVFLHPSFTAGILIEFVENLHRWPYTRPRQAGRAQSLISGFGVACRGVEASAAAFAKTMGSEVTAEYEDPQLGRSRDVVVSGISFQFFAQGHSRLRVRDLGDGRGELHHVSLGSPDGRVPAVRGGHADGGNLTDPAECFGVSFREYRRGQPSNGIGVRHSDSGA